MACGQESYFKGACLVFKRLCLRETQHVFASCAAQTRLHQFGGWSAQNDLAMIPDVVGVGMADENPLWTRLRFVCIEPKAQFGQVQTAGMKLDAQERH